MTTDAGATPGTGRITPTPAGAPGPTSGPARLTRASRSPGPAAARGDADRDELEMRARLGRSIRALRRRHGLTLVQLAARSDLSHPFLSQLERGLARPSMPSLHRIARALGTTQPALMSMDDASMDDAAEEILTRRVSLVPAGTGIPVDNPGGLARSLVSGPRAMYPILFEGALPEFGSYYTHPGDELIFVVDGAIEVDVEGEGLFQLGAGDTLCYPGGLAHRWRAIDSGAVRVLVVQDGRAAHH